MQLSTCISDNELLYVIETLGSDFTLADHWIVIRIGGDKQGLCKTSNSMVITFHEAF